MPPQTIITEKRSRIMVGMGHHAILSLTPISLPKNSVAFSDTFSPNSLACQPPSTYTYQMRLPNIPISLPQKILSHFRTHFPQILSRANQRNVEVIPGRQVASLLLIYARTV